MRNGPITFYGCPKDWAELRRLLSQRNKDYAASVSGSVRRFVKEEIARLRAEGKAT